MKKIIVLAFLLIFSINNITAQSESDATWEETIDWIKTKFESGYLNMFVSWYSDDGNNIIRDFQLIEINQKNVLLMDVVLLGNHGELFRDTCSTKADLKFLQRAKTLKWGDGIGITLKFKPDKVTQRISTKNEEPKITTESSISIYFEDEEMANRMLKAFNHLSSFNIANLPKEKF